MSIEKQNEERETFHEDKWENAESLQEGLDKLSRSTEYLNYRIAIMHQQMARLISPMKDYVKLAYSQISQQDKLIKALGSVDIGLKNVSGKTLAPLLEFGTTLSDLADILTAEVGAGLHANNAELRKTAKKLDILGISYDKSFGLMAMLEQTLGFSAEETNKFTRDIADIGLQYGTSTDKLIDALQELRQAMISATVVFGKEAGTNIGKLAAILTAKLPDQKEAIQQFTNTFLKGTGESIIKASQLGFTDAVSRIQGGDFGAVNEMLSSINKMVKSVPEGPSRGFFMDMAESAYGITSEIANLAETMPELADIQKALFDLQVEEAAKNNLDLQLTNLWNRFQPVLLGLYQFTADLLKSINNFADNNMGTLITLITIGLSMLNTNRIAQYIFWTRHMLELRLEMKKQVYLINYFQKMMHDTTMRNWTFDKQKEFAKNAVDRMVATDASMSRKRMVWELIKSNVIARAGSMAAGGITGLVVGLVAQAAITNAISKSQSEVSEEHLKTSQEALSLAKERTNNIVSDKLVFQLGQSLKILSDISSHTSTTAENTDPRNLPQIAQNINSEGQQIHVMQ